MLLRVVEVFDIARVRESVFDPYQKNGMESPSIAQYIYQREFGGKCVDNVDTCELIWILAQ
jgi:hypothetical protein